MGEKITTEIDPYIKQMFEVMKSKLGITYKDILEEGILAKLKDIDPIKAEEILIMQLELELSAHKMHLATLRVRSEHVMEKNTESQEAKAIETEREEWFDSRATKIIEAIDKGYVNYQLYVKKGPFTSAKQAKEWILSHISQWRKEHENRHTQLQKAPIPR